MKYLITGGAGFIGSHLAEGLLCSGDEVFVVDDLSTGSMENMRPIKTQDRFHYVIESCANLQLLAESGHPRGHAEPAGARAVGPDT